MPALGDTLRFIEPEPIDPETLAQHAEIDVAVQGLCRRMEDLAPFPRDRHWYSTDGVWRSGPKAIYTPEDNKNLEMSAWLETVNWRKGYGPSGRKADAHELEVNLYTKARAVDGALYGKRGRAERRVSSSVGKLSIWANEFFTVNLKEVPYESATNILSDIDFTLDLIEEILA